MGRPYTPFSASSIPSSRPDLSYLICFMILVSSFNVQILYNQFGLCRDLPAAVERGQRLGRERSGWGSGSAVGGDWTGSGRHRGCGMACRSLTPARAALPRLSGAWPSFIALVARWATAAATGPKSPSGLSSVWQSGLCTENADVGSGDPTAQGRGS